MRRLITALGFLALVISGTSPLRGQDSTWQAISGEGVVRSSLVVDSVFVDRLLPRATVGGGDFTAYLMARLGVNRIPPDFNYRVLVDSALIRIGGRLSDLPQEARVALNPLFILLAPDTRLVAEVELTDAGPRAAHFHLKAALIEGVPVPEEFLQPVMSGVGAQYPALTSSGRDLYVEIPAGGKITLLPDSVALIGP